MMAIINSNNNTSNKSNYSAIPSSSTNTDTDADADADRRVLVVAGADEGLEPSWERNGRSMSSSQDPILELLSLSSPSSMAATASMTNWWHRRFVPTLVVVVVVVLILAVTVMVRLTAVGSSSAAIPNAQGGAKNESTMAVFTNTAEATTATTNSTTGNTTATTAATTEAVTSTTTSASLQLPMPYGVNLGSWLALEDYFFVGHDGAVEVATPDDQIVAQCLPPLHTGSVITHQRGDTTDPVPLLWNSETDLFSHLVNRTMSVQHAILTFQAFRQSYFDWQTDLAKIAQLGIRKVRVPMSWCLTDYDPSHDDLLNKDNNDKETDRILLQRYTCRDPFFAQDQGLNVYWPAIPRDFVAAFLRACSQHGLEAILDIHTYPGATSPGTFSGVWPRQPIFWKFDQSDHPEQDFGRTLFRDLLTWLESLQQLDPIAFQGFGGITPMNEPAHLAGLYGPDSYNPNVPSYVPSLSDEQAQDYLTELHASDMWSNASSIVSVPNGPHLRVLLWQRDAVHAFRNTTLPVHGKQIIINVIESIFVAALVPDDDNDMGGRHAQAMHIITAWWRSTTTPYERQTWAVLDMHHYYAWEPHCQGTVTGHDGSYMCGNRNDTRTVLQLCSTWADTFRHAMITQVPNGTDAQIISGEFSASTHHTVLQSCTDPTTLRESYLAQMEASFRSNVSLIWWSWHMPYGGAFRPAWSLKQFLYLQQHPRFTSPDESVLPCGNG